VITMPSDEEIIKTLLKVTKESEVTKLLDSLDVADSSKDPNGHKYLWRLVGDSISNAANIHTTTVTIAPIIERITNGFDACIQVEEYKENNGPLQRELLPKSPRDAIEKWFKIPGGDTAKHGLILKDSERTRLAESAVVVELFDSDEKRNPTITISDYGIGQKPDQFSGTLLSLGKSNKFSQPHLQGTYGHGGSSTYRFCKYSIVISRRNPKILNGESEVGWTIVRQDSALEIWDQKNNRLEYVTQPPVYEYLCLANGDIPKISAKVADKYYKPITYISHIQYNAKEWENLSRGLGYRLFRNYLFDPILPFRLIDRRDKPNFSRNMFGDRSTLETAEYVVYKNTSEEDWEGKGKLLIRYWLLHNKDNPSDKPIRLHLERENSRNTIIVTLNGQRHGSLEKSIITKKSRLPSVGENLLVQVVLDYLPREVKGKLFTSGRMELVREGPEIELLEQKLIECFEEDKDLRGWDTKLGDVQIQDDESVKEVKQMLDRLIDIGIDIGFGSPNVRSVSGGIGTTEKYKPQDPPTNFEIKTQQDPLEFIKGEKKTITLELNGQDNLFTRRKNKGKIKCILPTDSGVDVFILTSQFRDGRLPVAFSPKSEATEWDTKKVKFVFEADNLKDSLEVERSYTVLPPHQYLAVDPPTELKIIKPNPIKLIAGKQNTINIGFNGPNDILDRTINQATFEVSFNYDKATLSRRIGPYNGRFQISLQIDDKAKEGDSFSLVCKLNLANGQALSDTRNCTICIPNKNEKKEKGGLTQMARPNYKMEPIRKEMWEQLSWSEATVGTFDVIKDQETGKDLLRLRINADAQYIDSERARRRALSYGEKGIKNIEMKYIAYVAYHLYQQFEADKEEYDAESPKGTEESNGKPTPQQLEEERQRMANTLILSFKTQKDLEED